MKKMKIVMMAVYVFAIIFFSFAVTDDYHKLCSGFSDGFKEYVDESFALRLVVCRDMAKNDSLPKFGFNDSSKTIIAYPSEIYQSADRMRILTYKLFINAGRFILLLYFFKELLSEIINIDRFKKKRDGLLKIKGVLDRAFDFFIFIFLFVLIFSARIVWRIG